MRLWKTPPSSRIKASLSPVALGVRLRRFRPQVVFRCLETFGDTVHRKLKPMPTGASLATPPAPALLRSELDRLDQVPSLSMNVRAWREQHGMEESAEARRAAGAALARPAAHLGNVARLGRNARDRAPGARRMEGCADGADLHAPCGGRSAGSRQRSVAVQNCLQSNLRIWAQGANRLSAGICSSLCSRRTMAIVSGRRPASTS